MDSKSLYLGMELGLLITIPLVGFLLLGVWMDDKMNTFPIFLLTGIIVGMGAAVLMVYKVIIPYLDKKVRNNKDNNKNNK